MLCPYQNSSVDHFKMFYCRMINIYTFENNFVIIYFVFILYVVLGSFYAKRWKATYCIRSGVDRFEKFLCIFSDHDPQTPKPPSFKKVIYIYINIYIQCILYFNICNTKKNEKKVCFFYKKINTYLEKYFVK